MKRVLLVNPFGIGDVLFTVPLLRALKSRGVERLDVILGSRTSDVLRNSPYVDEIISIQKDELKELSLFRVAAYILQLLIKLRARKYDTLIDLSLTREYAFWSAAVLGIRRRVGFNFKGRGSFLTDRIELPEGFSGKHVLEHYQDLAKVLSLEIDKLDLEWAYSEGERSSAHAKAREAGFDWTQTFLVFAPGGGASWGKDAVFKQWAPEKFARLVHFLSSEWSIRNVVVVGSSLDKLLAARFLQTCPLNIFDLTGVLALGEVAALIEKCVCFVGNDGGLLHLAKAVGSPTISVFGPVDPVVYGPYPRTEWDALVYYHTLECRPCYHKFRYKSDCEHRTCLTQLTVDEAIRQLRNQSLLQLIKARSYETAS